MKFLVLLAVFVCVSLKIDAFPQQDPAQILESAPNNASNVPKVDSIEPNKAVENKNTVQNASPLEQSSVPVAVPVPAEQKETPSISPDSSKQTNGETSNVKTETTAKKSDNIPPKADNLPEIKDADDVSEKGIETDLTGSTTEKDTEKEDKEDSFEFDFGFNEAGKAAAAGTPDSSEMVGDSEGPCDDSGMEGGSAEEEQKTHRQFSNIRDLIQRIHERICTLLRNRFRQIYGISDDDTITSDVENLNFPAFSVTDDLQ